MRCSWRNTGEGNYWKNTRNGRSWSAGKNTGRRERWRCGRRAEWGGTQVTGPGWWNRHKTGVEGKSGWRGKTGERAKDTTKPKRHATGTWRWYLKSKHDRFQTLTKWNSTRAQHHQLKIWNWTWSSASWLYRSFRGFFPSTHYSFNHRKIGLGGFLYQVNQLTCCPVHLLSWAN